MEGFNAAFRNELDKLYRKKKIILGIILAFAMIIIGQAAVSLIRSNLGLRTAGGMEFPVLVLSFFSNTILPLFSTLIAIDLFSGEFSSNIMKITLMRPVSRLKVYTSKIVLLAVFILANLLTVMALSMAAGLLFNGFNVTFNGIIRVIIAYAVTLIPVLSLAILVVFFTNIINSGTGIFFLMFLIYLVMKGAGILFGSFSGLLVTSMLDWYNLWIADTLPLWRIIWDSVYMLGFSMMFFVTGYYLFDKKDL